VSACFESASQASSEPQFTWFSGSHVSARPPIDIVRRYPNVTLLRAEENSGPYRLVRGIPREREGVPQQHELPQQHQGDQRVADALHGQHVAALPDSALQDVRRQCRRGRPMGALPLKQ